MLPVLRGVFGTTCAGHDFGHHLSKERHECSPASSLHGLHGNQRPQHHHEAHEELHSSASDMILKKSCWKDDVGDRRRALSPFQRVLARTPSLHHHLLRNGCGGTVFPTSSRFFPTSSHGHRLSNIFLPRQSKNTACASPQVPPRGRSAASRTIPSGLSPSRRDYFPTATYRDERGRLIVRDLRLPKFSDQDDMDHITSKEGPEDQKITFQYHHEEIPLEAEEVGYRPILPPLCCPYRRGNIVAGVLDGHGDRTTPPHTQNRILVAKTYTAGLLCNSQQRQLCTCEMNCSECSLNVAHEAPPCWATTIRTDRHTAKQTFSQTLRQTIRTDKQTAERTSGRETGSPLRRPHPRTPTPPLSPRGASPRDCSPDSAFRTALLRVLNCGAVDFRDFCRSTRVLGRFLCRNAP